MGAIKDFRDFILRGNVVDLAVGIVIGVAFGAVVAALVKDIITPLIGIFGGFDFSSWSFTVNGSKFLIGDFHQRPTHLYYYRSGNFLVVRPVNSLMDRFKKPEPEVSDLRDCPFCKSSISKEATRCPYCTSELQAQASA